MNNNFLNRTFVHNAAPLNKYGTVCNSGGGSFDQLTYYRPVTYNGTHTASSVEVLMEPLIGSAATDEAFAVIDYKLKFSINSII